MSRKRLNREQEEKEQQKKQKTEPHLHTIIKVARDEDFTKQIGKDIYFDLVDFDKVTSLRVPNQTTFNLVKEELAKLFGLPVKLQRLWLWAKRQNHTYRPVHPLTYVEEKQDVGSYEDHNAELKLFLEVRLRPDWLPRIPFIKTKHDILLFIKLYDPQEEELSYVGKLFVKDTHKPTLFLTMLKEMAGFTPSEDIELYEEIKFEPFVMCLPINRKLSFRDSQLEDGDIICIQKSHSADNRQQFRYPDVPSFLEYMSRHQTHDMPYGEPLDPMPDLQDLKTLEVAFHHATRDEVTIHHLKLPKPSTVGDMISELKTKVELSHPDAELRLLEVFYNKIFKIFQDSEKIEYIDDQYGKLRAEEILEEEKSFGPHGRLIHVYHFTKETVLDQTLIRNFGEPFLLVIREGETLGEVKKRIQRKLRVSDVEFAEWKFSLVTRGQPEYLEDTDNLSCRFQKIGVYGAGEQYLGLEHADNASNRSDAAHQPSGGLTCQKEASIEERRSRKSSPHSEGTSSSTELADFDLLLKSDSDSVQEIKNSQLKPTVDLDRAKAVIKEIISMPIKDGLSDNKVSQLASLADLLVSNEPEFVDCLKSVCNGSLKSRLEYSVRLLATSEDGLLRLQETEARAYIARTKYKEARDSSTAASAEGAELQKQIDSTEEEIHRLQEKLSGLKEKKSQVDDRASSSKKKLHSLGNDMKSEVTILTELKKSRLQWLAQKTMAMKEFSQLEAEWDQLRKTFL